MIIVYLALVVMTGVTVGLSYLHLPTGQAVALAMLVAATKATLIGLYFMHLRWEKKIIYGTLALTAVVFAFVMTIGFY